MTTINNVAKENNWDSAAKEYSNFIGEEGDFIRQAVINPYLKKWLAGSGGRALDLGCGEGYLARLFSPAFEFTNLDFSGELLAEAKRKNTPGNFSQADIGGHLDLAENYFDAVIANMVLMDVAEVKNVYQNAYRFLKSGGMFIATVVHPACGRPAAKWFKTWREKILRREPFARLDSYGAEFAVEQKIIGLNNFTQIYHRSIASYVQQAIDAGFILRDISELAPSRSDLIKFNQLLFLAKFPAVLGLVFEKSTRG